MSAVVVLAMFQSMTHGFSQHHPQTNPRASDISKKIGLNLDVKGDVFISRCGPLSHHIIMIACRCL
jgi:hypothetical protein